MDNSYSRLEAEIEEIKRILWEMQVRLGMWIKPKTPPTPREFWIHPSAIDTLQEKGSYSAAISKDQEGRTSWIKVREVTDE